MTITGERIDDSSAAEEIGGNEDLVTEILLRLPVKSLLRFESVSKKWLSLISYPHFSHNYARLHNPNYEPSGLLLTHECSPLQFIPFNGDNDHARVRHSFPSYPGMLILQSCNGLLLCSSPTFSYCKSEYYIYNPTTKQSTTIRFPSPEFKGAVVAVNLAFDPLKSPHYKLLSIRTMNKKTLAYQIDIYSSETGSWRPPISGDPLIFTAPSGISMVEPVYCRGAIHWYTELDISLYFNTDTECLKTMPMPPFNEGLNFNNVRYFGEYRGHLHLIVIKKPLATEFDIWELETDYSGWFVRYRVNLDAVIIAFHPEVTRICDDDTVAFSVLCVARAEKEEESTLVLSVPGKAISFNLHKKTSKKLCDLMPILKLASLALDYDYFCAYQYIETLFHV